MSMSIDDPDFKLLADFAAALKSEYAEMPSPWLDSPFAWLKGLPSTSIGAIGVKLVKRWLGDKGFGIKSAPDREADMLVNERRFEVKLSTLWKSGFYRFQQLRDQNYEFVLCLGLSPFDAHCWLIPKATVMDAWKGTPPRPEIKSQHKGEKGTETAWLTVRPGREPQWLKEWSIELSNVAPRIKAIMDTRPD